MCIVLTCLRVHCLLVIRRKIVTVQWENPTKLWVIKIIVNYGKVEGRHIVPPGAIPQKGHTFIF